MHHVIILYALQLGMVQLLGAQLHCPVKLMIVNYNNQQFVGHVPSEQVAKYVIRIVNVCK